MRTKINCFWNLVKIDPSRLSTSRRQDTKSAKKLNCKPKKDLFYCLNISTLTTLKSSCCTLLKVSTLDLSADPAAN